MARIFRPLREWCPYCCTDHTPEARCPGPLLATGEERHGWRVLVKTPFGSEIYGILVAPGRGVWRARVITYPNILWVLPDGGSMKFVGDGPREAEHLAIEFIKYHCSQRDLKIEKKLPVVDSGAVDPELAAVVSGGLTAESTKRKLQGVPLKFGVGHVTESASTDNLSEGGMFIRTQSPLPPESSILIELEVDGLRIPLKGVVYWTRPADENGRPAGMGIKLDSPPPRYIHCVRQKLQPERSETLPDVCMPAGPAISADISKSSTVV